MEGPQDCFKHVLIRRQFSWLPMCDCNICNALKTGFSTCFLCWIHWFGEHLQPPGGMVVTTNMDLMETQFSRNLGTRMIAQVWKRKAWYFKAKRLESALFGVFISFGVTHLRGRHLCQDLRKSGSIHWQGQGLGVRTSTREWDRDSMSASGLNLSMTKIRLYRNDI